MISISVPDACVLSVGRATPRGLGQVTDGDDEDKKQNNFHFTKADVACASAALIKELSLFGRKLWNIISSVTDAAESLAAFNKRINDIDDSLLPLMLVKVFSLFSPFYPSRL